jgi:hypothetical protein
MKIDTARVPVQVLVALQSSWRGLVFACGVKNWLDSSKRLSEQTLGLFALVPLQENSGEGVQFDNVVAPLHVEFDISSTVLNLSRGEAKSQVE